jgi:DNA-directed RNA polymerase subunit RPC12/RpoP
VPTGHESRDCLRPSPGRREPNHFRPPAREGSRRISFSQPRVPSAGRLWSYWIGGALRRRPAFATRSDLVVSGAGNSPSTAHQPEGSALRGAILGGGKANGHARVVDLAFGPGDASISDLFGGGQAGAEWTGNRRTRATMIRFTCSHCEREIQTTGGGGGLTSHCPDCGQPLVMPGFLGNLNTSPEEGTWEGPSCPPRPTDMKVRAPSPYGGIDLGESVPVSRRPTITDAITAQPPPPPIVDGWPDLATPTLGELPRPGGTGFRCPYCNSDVRPIRLTKLSPGAWVFLCLSLLFCLPLFWIAFFIKEDYLVCRDCGTKLL